MMPNFNAYNFTKKLNEKNTTENKKYMVISHPLTSKSK